MTRLDDLRDSGTLAACGYDFANHWADVGGVRLHHVDEGDGPPIVFVHGNPTWSFYWRHLIRELRPTHRCIALDHVGCGFSDKPDDASYTYTLERRVQDLGALIDSLGLERVSLVVHDWGGMIGTAWACRNPHRVARMAVLNTSAFHLPRDKPLPGLLRSARTGRIGEALVRGANAFVLTAAWGLATVRPLPPDVRRCYAAPYDSWSNRIAIARFVQDIPLGPEDAAWRVVDEVEASLHLLADVPMLLCWGMRDFVFDADFLSGWEQRFPRAEVHRFDDAGHYVLEDAREAVVPKVRDFLRG